VAGVASPRHPRDTAVDGDATAAVGQTEPFGAAHRGERERPERHLEARAREQPCGDDGFRDRHRRGVATGGADDNVRVEPGAARTARVLGDERQRETAFFERAPELVGPRALLGGLDQLLGREIGEQPRDGVGKQRAEIFGHCSGVREVGSVRGWPALDGRG